MSFIIEDFRQTSIDNWYWFQEALTPAEVKVLEELQQKIPFKQAVLSTDKHDLESYRKSDIKWLPQQDPEFTWLYEKTPSPKVKAAFAGYLLALSSSMMARLSIAIAFKISFRQSW